MSEYIKRDKAINTIAGITTSMSVCLNIDECHGMKKMQQQAVMEIANMPPEDVQPVVHGEWIKTMEGNAFRDKCSECGSLYPNAFGYNWCPTCGAKMDKRKGADNE